MQRSTLVSNFETHDCVTACYCFIFSWAMPWLFFNFVFIYQFHYFHLVLYRSIETCPIRSSSPSFSHTICFSIFEIDFTSI